MIEHTLAVRPELKMEISQDRLVHIAPRVQRGRLLDVKMKGLTIRDAQHLDAAVASILETPEVQAEVAASGFTLGRLQTGIYALPPLNSGKVPPVPMTLTAISVREALDKLAQFSGKGVWVYAERNCNDRAEVTVGFDRQ